ncbi:histidine--tRNA ligase [Rhodoferax sp. PAMC 29310]|uniref:histidine--tRNA ligase n=1 Tax=Rhodoferax sp. PAMC 29310 TaxID=2822760 RepID=UPI001B32B5E9|nr:histidine--tRNA ligase [Rhodoferax sp. PAMC 29310]
MPRFEKLTGVKGMNDIMPPQSAAVEWLEGRIRTVMARYAYKNIRTPIVERTPLFVRGLGQVTDVVEKEMYSFEDRLNGDPLTLRPEGTAGVVRSVIEHSMLYDGGKRFYYIGPMFRHERPQRGRYRQFDQIGAEALGFSGAEIDAELILLAVALWSDLGLTDVRLELNSLGQPEERHEHRKALIAYFESHHDELDEDSRRRLHTNPLRILDTKNPALQKIVDGAPRPIDYLGEQSLAHFSDLKRILDENQVSYTVNPRLVRGLDYYNLTVFEFTTDRLGSQGTVCAGGRYDYLIENLGGKSAPAVGWALGVDRILELLKEQGLGEIDTALDAYAIVANLSGLPRALRVLQKLRSEGVSIQMQASSDSAMASLKSQFKRADSSGAHFALVFGDEEVKTNSVTIKSLRDGTGLQVSQSLDSISDWAPTLQLRA